MAAKGTSGCSDLDQKQTPPASETILILNKVAAAAQPSSPPGEGERVVYAETFELS